jgi:hypothetical protein
MTAPNLSPQTMKRLAFIRLLYGQGVDQSRLPEPLNVTSILSMHDAVELFLILTGEHLSATLPDRIEFMKYWIELRSNKLSQGVDLSGKTAMDRLNRIRNAFKHAGTMPGIAAVEQARADVTNFFEDNIPKVFNIIFDDIDMADILPQPHAQDKLKKSAVANAAGDRVEAMALLVEAFDELFNEHVRPSGYPPSAFSFGANISFPLDENDIHSILRQPDNASRRIPARGAERLARQISDLTEVVIAVQAAMRVTAIGLDYSRYYRFRQLTPQVNRTLDGNSHRNYPSNYAPTQEEFEHCRQFVITVAFRLAEL